jgi:hypothetical protein
MRFLRELWGVLFWPQYPCWKNHPHATIDGRDACNRG